MKQYLLLSAAALALTFASIPAHAEASKAPAAPAGFGPIDANNDQKVTKAEADAAAGKEFAAFDANSDGKISTDEFKAVLYKLNAKLITDDAAKKKAEPMIQGRFKALDADSNGSVSKAEFLGDSTRRHKTLDENGDGTVTKAEVDSVQAKVKKQIEAMKAKAAAAEKK